jgi:hypothetical protein
VLLGKDVALRSPAERDLAGLKDRLKRVRVRGAIRALGNELVVQDVATASLCVLHIDAVFESDVPYEGRWVVSRAQADELAAAGAVRVS